MTTLFPELDATLAAPKSKDSKLSKLEPQVVSSNEGRRTFAGDKKVIEQELVAWAKSHGDRFDAEIKEDSVRVNNVTVDYASNAKSSEELQERKRAQLALGQELYFVFPWEVEAIKSLISHFNARLNIDSRHFSARRLKAEKIDNTEANAFAKANHIQKSASGSEKVSYGLRHKETGELLAVQQYCKTRWGIKKLGPDSTIWEGLRLVIKNDVHIHGAATKLQKLFLAEKHPTQLISYVDFSHSLGEYKKTQGFQSEVSSNEAFRWVLDTDTPKDIMIIDKNGEERHPELDKVLATPYLNPNRMAGAFGRGVGQTFYDNRKLGSRKQLKEQGNELYHNDLILEGIGYKKVFTAGQLKWSKLFPENEVENNKEESETLNG